jgi:hypothetical protein
MDNTDLIKRLREAMWSDFSGGNLFRKAADALETQATRIAELERLTDSLEKSWRMRGERCDKAEADLTIRLVLGEKPRGTIDFRAAGKAAAEWIDEHPEVLGVVRSCETCKHRDEGGCTYLSRINQSCLQSDLTWWESKSTLCPTCSGSGEHSQANSGWSCPDCGGTGKKETK